MIKLLIINFNNLKMKKSFNSSSNISNNNEKFFALKIKLDNLNYRIPFDIGSCNLIDALVNDINQYLLEIKSLSQEKKEFSTFISNKDLSIAAAKHENNRLIKENNDLHREIIETKKKINYSTSAKELEIKRLTEEKNDLKYLYNNLKLKAQHHEKEASSLRKKLYKLLIHIYETNMNEKTLRKMFEKDFNIKLFEQLSEKREPIDLDVYMHKREIAISNTIESNDFFQVETHENNKIEENENPKSKYLIDAIKQTFADGLNKSFSPKTSNIDFNKEDNLFKISSQGNSKETQINDLKFQIEKLNMDLHEKDKEILKLNRYCKNENSNDKDFIINYLKDEKLAKEEGAESKINYLLKENRILQKLNNEFSDRIKNMENQCPYLIEIEVKLNKLLKSNAKFEKENSTLESELKTCKEDLKRCKAEIAEKNLKTVPKEMLETYEESYSKLHNSLNSAHEVIKILDDKQKSEQSINNSHKNIMICQVNNLNKDIKKSESEKNVLEEKLKILNSQQVENSERINNLNLHLMQKENTINELNEFIENLNSKFEQNEIGKNDMVTRITELEDNLKSIKEQLKLKDNDIVRLNNLKEILQKQIALHK